MKLKIFTNAFEGNASKKLAVDVDRIISVYEAINTETSQRVTVLFAGEQTWQVSESFNMAIKIINGEK
jgi:hypothetical protein